MSLPDRRARHLIAQILAPLLKSGMFWQLVRFAITGVGVTLLSMAAYLTATYVFHLTPLTANALSHSLGLCVSFLAHSRWSFSDHGASNQAAIILRFCAVSAISFTMNTCWVAIMTHQLQLPAWTPVPLMFFVTPLISFLLNRHWVFEATAGARAN